MTQDEIRYDLLKTELELCQKQMDKYDQMSATVKAWAVTLWAASLGWSFQIMKKDVILLSMFIVLAFWVLDAANKNFRQDYKKRRDEVASLLQKIFRGEVFGGAVSPDLPAHQWRRLAGKIIEPHVSILYLALILVSLAVFWVI